MHTTDLEKLLHYHEQAVQTLRRALALFHGKQSPTDGNGERPPTVLKRPYRRRKKVRSSDQIDASRDRSIALLDTFDAVEPRPLTGDKGRVGALVHYGYLRRTQGGYVLTGKPFQRRRGERQADGAD